jgi:hypothetical protein
MGICSRLRFLNVIVFCCGKSCVSEVSEFHPGLPIFQFSSCFLGEFWTACLFSRIEVCFYSIKMGICSQLRFLKCYIFIMCLWCLRFDFEDNLLHLNVIVFVCGKSCVSEVSKFPPGLLLYHPSFCTDIWNYIIHKKARRRKTCKQLHSFTQSFTTPTGIFPNFSFVLEWLIDFHRFLSFLLKL